MLEEENNVRVDGLSSKISRLKGVSNLFIFVPVTA